jgi:hypothetical protein
MPTVQIESSKRGLFGWIIAVLFWGWQALMVVWLAGAVTVIGQKAQDYHTHAEQTGVAIGATVGAAFILFVWVLGAAILGMMMIFTRGRREITTIERT